MQHIKYWLTVAILLTPAVALAELAGSWTLTIDTPRGVQHPKMEVQQTDAGYTGTYHSIRGPLPMKNIQSDGTNFSFDMTITVPIGEIDVSYVGTIDGDELTGQVTNPRGQVPFSGVRD